MSEYRWEYSSLADWGNYAWKHAIDPALRFYANQDLDFLRRTRGVIQLTLLTAIVFILVSFFFKTSHMLTASGLLFDIAGVLRLFLLEQIEHELAGFKENKYGNVPSVAMRELIMPEATGPYDADSHHMSLFYYKRRGILFLFLGFVLQFIGDLF